MSTRSSASEPHVRRALTNSLPRGLTAGRRSSRPPAPASGRPSAGLLTGQTDRPDGRVAGSGLSQGGSTWSSAAVPRCRRKMDPSREGEDVTAVASMDQAPADPGPGLDLGCRRVATRCGAGHGGAAQADGWRRPMDVIRKGGWPGLPSGHAAPRVPHRRLLQFCTEVSRVVTCPIGSKSSMPPLTYGPERRCLLLRQPHDRVYVINFSIMV